MENFTNNSEFLKNVEEKIQQKVSFAKEHALTQEEYKIVSEMEFEMQGIQNERELTDEEVNYYHDFRQKMNDATVEVETLPEMRRVMGVLGFDAHSIVDIMSHENAHGNKAEQLGAQHLGYRFMIIKGDNGGIIVQPQASLYIPDEWDAEKQKAVHLATLQAPDEYGNEISDSDKKSLDQINNKK